jgi:cytochrome b561
MSSDHNRHASDRYPRGASILHWLMAALILALIALGWYMAGIPKGTPARAYYFNLHKSLGLVAALGIAAFIGWRLRRAPPPVRLAPWEARLMKPARALMYLSLVLVPLSGYVEANFSPYGIRFFGWPLPPWGPDDKALYHFFNRLHVYSANAFAALIALHIGAALKHFLIDRDRILHRILPFG